MRVSSLLAVLLITASAASAQANQSPVEEAARIGDRIEMSQVPSQGSVQWGQAIAVLDAPTAQVMETVWNYGAYHEFLPFFNTSRVLSQRGHNALVYMQASVIRNTTTLHAQVRIFARRPQGATQIVEARMTEGNMDQFAARWEVTPLDNGARTFVRFRILVDPDLPLPASVFSNENKQVARRTLESLRIRLRNGR